MPHSFDRTPMMGASPSRPISSMTLDIYECLVPTSFAIPYSCEIYSMRNYKQRFIECYETNHIGQCSGSPGC